MSFNTIPFLFVFFPAALLIFRLVPERTKNIVLVILSLLFYAWDSVSGLLLLIFSMAFNYFAALEIQSLLDHGNRQTARTALITSVAADLALLGFYKYAGFFAGIFGVQTAERELPLGISFFTFTVLSYVSDVYYGKAEAERRPVPYMLYVSLFPKIISGPVVEYRDIVGQLEHHPVKASAFRSGVKLFLIGLFKKVLIADPLGSSFASLRNSGSLASATAWLGMIFYSLQLFYDFSGYSDMAIGIAKMFGFSIDKNFDHPYISDGVTDFWRRWHISLGHWFRDYVYIPMGGNRCSTKRLAVNLMTVWILTGFWHGAGWNFIFWGIYHGAWVLLDRFAIRKIFDTIPRFVRIALTDLIACFGWIFFFSPSIGSAFGWIGNMFGSAHAGFWNGATTYYLYSNLVLLLIAVIFCSPVPGEFIDSISVRNRNSVLIASIGYAVLFIFSIAAIVSNTYTSFLYFRF